ncbi:MAG: 3-dehydroquinate synthase [Myxococcales bacterium]|nr:3-dehydroquinate synthase [Myxococcales bacterium]|tara:strand:+ start:1488 stop:2516 length:1029 start_codon:yes stop_codon:yes gene_type:complete
MLERTEILIPVGGFLTPTEPVHPLVEGPWQDCLGDLAQGRRVLLVGERRVVDAHDLEVDIILAGGERQKSLEAATQLARDLVVSGIDRNHLLVAIGGGATTDLVGFVASVTLRGIPWLPIPTTTLAMVDASIGGKTAVNLPEGKNLVGSFHQPEGVIVDRRLLTSLPHARRMEGLIELVKTALCHGALGEKVLAAGSVEELEALLFHGAQVKLDLVSRDPLDKGPRQALNLGHTVGHALEALFMPRLSHGEAVAIGLVPVLRMGLGDGAQPWLEALQRVGLPLKPPNEVDRDQLLAFMQRDKKGGKMVVPRPGYSVELWSDAEAILEYIESEAFVDTPPTIA